MRMHMGAPSFHFCTRVELRATHINDDGTPSSADHVKIFVVDQDGSLHEIAAIYLPIALARAYDAAILEVNKANQVEQVTGVEAAP